MRMFQQFEKSSFLKKPLTSISDNKKGPAEARPSSFSYLTIFLCISDNKKGLAEARKRTRYYQHCCTLRR